MSYGKVAVDSVTIIVQNQKHILLHAWIQALIQNNVGDKDCPRVAFLGLCEDGYVVGVPNGSNGSYIGTSNSVIKQRAVQIRKIIMTANPPALPTATNASIWTRVGGTGQDQGVIELIYELFRNSMLQ
jgi:hypothetical protein